MRHVKRFFKAVSRADAFDLLIVASLSFIYVLALVNTAYNYHEFDCVAPKFPYMRLI